MDLYAHFKFNKAGQGCFYSGRIEISDQKIFMAYDCGTHSTESYLLNEISQFKKEINNNTGVLDLLIISHFDEDHVNKVSDLLSGIQCDTVIIPYVTAIERLWLVLAFDSENSEYISFLRDPIMFLNERGVKRIIVIGSGENIEGFEGINPDESGGPNIEPPNIVNKLAKYKNSYRERMIPFITSLTNPSMINNIDFCTDQGWLIIWNLWKFKFYNRKVEDDKLSKFLKYIVKQISQGSTHFTNNNLINLLKANNIEKLKKSYKKYFTNLNSSSLVLYHAPTKIYKLILNTFRFFNGYDYIYNNKTGTFLTGDIDFFTKPKYRKIIDHFRMELPDISIIQIPHHGSKCNWYFRKPNDFLNFDFLVINFGLGNKFKHPSQSVIDDIENNCRGNLILNHQFKSFNYFFNIIY